MKFVKDESYTDGTIRYSFIVTTADAATLGLTPKHLVFLAECGQSDRISDHLFALYLMARDIEACK